MLTFDENKFDEMLPKLQKFYRTNYKILQFLTNKPTFAPKFFGVLKRLLFYAFKSECLNFNLISIQITEMQGKLVQHFQKTGEFRCFCIAMEVLSFFVQKLSVSFWEKINQTNEKKLQVLLESLNPKKVNSFFSFLDCNL